MNITSDYLLFTLTFVFHSKQHEHDEEHDRGQLDSGIEVEAITNQNHPHGTLLFQNAIAMLP
jgi:hypothetical protein